jgi:hypothetical protein
MIMLAINYQITRGSWKIYQLNSLWCMATLMFLTFASLMEAIRWPDQHSIMFIIIFMMPMLMIVAIMCFITAAPSYYQWYQAQQQLQHLNGEDDE